MSSEGGFPFITRSDADEVVGTTEVNLGVDGGGAEVIKEVGNEQRNASRWKRIKDRNRSCRCGEHQWGVKMWRHLVLDWCGSDRI